MSDEQIVQIHKGIHSQELFQAFENSLQGNELKRSDKRLLKDIEIFQNVVLGEMSSRGIKLYDKSISMEDAMLHPQARHDFKNFCESELTEENFNFYHDVQNYRQLSGQAQVDEAKRMMDKYIISNVEENQGYISFMDINREESQKINIDSFMFDNINEDFSNGQLDGLFDDAFEHVEDLLQTGVFPRFIKSAFPEN